MDRLLKRIALLTAAALLAALALGAGPAQADGGGATAKAAAKRCSVSGKQRRLGASYVTRISVTRTSCASAERVVRAFHSCRRRNGGADGRCGRRVRRYRCKERRGPSSKTQYDATVTCRRGAARVSHAYTQFT